MEITIDMQICNNCAHWDYASATLIPVYDEKGKCIKTDTFAPCRVHAIEVDSPDSIALTGAYGHCHHYNGAFEASEDFLNDLEEEEAEEEAIEATNRMLRKWLFEEGNVG